MVTVNTYTVESGKTKLISDSVSFFNKEVYGIGCGDGFASMLKRFHAINVLECHNDLTRSEIQCLESKIYTSC